MPRLFRTILPILLLGGLVTLPGAPLRAAVLAGSVVSRAEGRAPVEGGRSDLAFQHALDEAFRKNLIEALHTIAPDRRSPRDFETWQETVLSHAADFIGAYRILSQEEKEGFLQLAVEVEIYRDKLARAARSSGAATAPTPVRLLVLVDPFPIVDRAADEEIDAGTVAAADLEAEFARRGAIIVASTNRAPWRQAEGPASEENRAALATAAGKRLQAEMVLLARITRRAEETFILTAHLIAVGSETTLGSAREEFAIAASGGLTAAFSPPVRRVAAALGPRLAGFSPSLRSKGTLP